MKKSLFNVFVEKEDHVLVYNSRSTGFARMSPAQFSLAKKLLEGIMTPDQTSASMSLYQQLVKGQFLIPDEMDEMEILKVRNRLTRFSAKGLGMVIAPTLRCNFACEYCYVDLNANKMKKAERQRLKTFFDKKLPENSSAAICWTGGDPSLAMDVVEELSEFFIQNCEEKNSNYDAVIITNGYLLNQNMVDQIKRCQLNSVQITLDGYREEHNAHRFLASKKPTFDRILDNIQGACEQININLRINVDKRNIDSMPMLINELSERGFPGKITVYFARIDAMNEMSKDYAENTFRPEEYSDIESRLYQMLFDHGFLLGRNTITGLRGSFCGANSQNHFVVDPQLNLLKCYTDFGMADKFGIGYVGDDGFEKINNPGNLIKWLGWDPFEIEECRNCKVLPLCMGGCSYKVITQGLGMEHACIQLRWSLEQTLETIGERIISSKSDGCRACDEAVGGCPV